MKQTLSMPVTLLPGRDWSRYLEDIAKANVLINSLEELKTKGLVSDNEYHQWKAEGELFRLW